MGRPQLTLREILREHEEEVAQREAEEAIAEAKYAAEIERSYSYPVWGSMYDLDYSWEDGTAFLDEDCDDHIEDEQIDVRPYWW